MVIRIFFISFLCSHILFAQKKPHHPKQVPIDSLPPGKGQITVLQTCTRCHSGQTISQNRLSKAAWSSVINEMEKKHGLSPLDSVTKKTILNYLVLSFSHTKKKKHPMGKRPTNPLPRG